LQRPAFPGGFVDKYSNFKDIPSALLAHEIGSGGLAMVASGNSMLTVEEVAAIPLFADLPLQELERLARNSADLQLSAGEFAVHEGGEGALFVVISGRIEVVKTFDGVERTLGWRLPGTIFGEVPLSLGSPFPGGYRAAETSRVMRIEVQQYYAVASVAKDVAQKVNALARERLGGLQAIATEPHKSRVTLVGHRWDAACSDLRRFLARNQISFDWVTPDAPAAAAILGSRPGAEGPVARLADGAIIEKPEVRDLANRLGLQTSPRADRYDVAIVGGGPAGLAAAVYGASEGLSTIVVEREAPGGQAGTSSRIENYLGFPSGISGDELASRESTRHDASARKSLSRGRSSASILQGIWFRSMAASSCAPAASSWRPAWRGDASTSKAWTG